MKTRLDAYWFWSRLPTEKNMRDQLRSFRDAGFVRIYIQARLSLPREIYLSDGWLRAYATAVGIMSELGLNAGLYDDYAWISGHAGGRTVGGADHLRERHLFWAAGTGAELGVNEIEATLGASLGPAARHWMHEGGIPLWTGWEIVAQSRKSEIL